MNRLIFLLVFLAGLAAVGWVGAGYAGQHALAQLSVALIAVVYLAGGLELRRFHQNTQGLAHALASLDRAPAALADWLQQVPAALRDTVRLRVEGERVALPGPALAPYLAGLLVLLGMLGTFMGMVLTLRGTGAALDGATGLAAIRQSLSAPVRGLGLAFGASVAGVAASAMLGLLTALLRRERAEAGRRLDARIAAELRPFTRAHQRDAAFELMRQQAHALPAVAEALQTLMADLERRNQSLQTQMLGAQENFHAQVADAYRQLAASVDQSLRTSLLEGARAAGAGLQPVVDRAMAGIENASAQLNDALTARVQQQLDALTQRFEVTSADVARSWQGALAEHREASGALAERLAGLLEGAASGVEQRSGALVDGMAARLQAAGTQWAGQWQDLLEAQRLGSAQASEALHRQLSEAAARLDRHGADLAQAVQASQGRLQQQLAEADQARLSAWTQALAGLADGLHAQWQQTTEAQAARQQGIVEALAESTRAVAAQTEARADRTLAEIDRVMTAAAEAPRVAAEVVTELRGRLDESMARDQAMLQERARLLETLATLLDAVQHASGAQRGAVDALVSTSAALMERVGGRFGEQADAQTARMAETSAQLSASAVEVASLGEAFGAAMQQFSDTSERLGARLERIEAALDKSLARSDEQLAYYVAQAREVIELSIASQQHVAEDLRRAAARQDAAA